jgi:hypothetical protein
VSASDRKAESPAVQNFSCDLAPPAVSTTRRTGRQACKPRTRNQEPGTIYHLRSAIFHYPLRRFLSNHAAPPSNTNSADDGSGTVATRNPTLPISFEGESKLRYDARRRSSLLDQEPPRSLREEPVTNVSSPAPAFYRIPLPIRRSSVESDSAASSASSFESTWTECEKCVF